MTSDRTPLYLHLGVLHAEIEKPDEAFRFFTEALDSDAGNADAHFDMALFLMKQGRTAEAISHYSETLQIMPSYLDALNNLAWIMATDGNEDIRNGERAVKLAENAFRLAVNRDPFLLDTLAAAYAEAGRFENARRHAEEAIKLARLKGYGELVNDIEVRLRLYRSNRPYHEMR